MDPLIGLVNQIQETGGSDLGSPPPLFRGVVHRVASRGGCSILFPPIARLYRDTKAAEPAGQRLVDQRPCKEREKTVPLFPVGLTRVFTGRMAEEA